jgi:hypothetical protein
VCGASPPNRDARASFGDAQREATTVRAVRIMDATIGHGVICTLDECARRAKEADGHEVSIRTLGVLERFDTDTERGTLRATSKSASGADDVHIDVDFSAVRRDEDSAFDGAVRTGSRVCVIGEARRVGDEALFEIRARVVRAMDGLDMRAYGKALEIRRKFLGETPP